MRSLSTDPYVARGVSERAGWHRDSAGTVGSSAGSSTDKRCPPPVASHHPAQSPPRWVDCYSLESVSFQVRSLRLVNNFTRTDLDMVTCSPFLMERFSSLILIEQVQK